MKKKKLIVIKVIIIFIISINSYSQDYKKIPIKSIKFNNKILFLDSHILEMKLLINKCDTLGNYTEKERFYRFEYKKYKIIFDGKEFMDSSLDKTTSYRNTSKFYPEIEIKNIRLRVLGFIKIKQRRLIQVSIVYGPFGETFILKRKVKNKVVLINNRTLYLNSR